MQDLKVTLIQRALHWEDPVANQKQFDTDMEALAGTTDLVLLPEMFTTGFSMRAAASAEEEANETLPWLAGHAARYGFAIAGSIPVRSGDSVFNRLLCVTPGGDAFHYDKRHLFRMSGEDRHYAAGTQRILIHYRGWRLCPMICYDLRFPVWSRNLGDYDALLYVANWPAKRAGHWRQLLIARAIENQAYTLGVNRIGSDANGIDYSGDSLALAADGEILQDCGDASGAFTVTLSADALHNYRSKFPVYRDADGFQLD